MDGLLNRRGRGEFPKDAPADTTVIFFVFPNMSHNFEGLDAAFNEAMNHVIQNTYGNFVGVNIDSIQERNNDGRIFKQIDLSFPTPTSWNQLDKLMIELDVACDALLEHEWNAQYYITWLGQRRFGDSSVELD